MLRIVGRSRLWLTLGIALFGYALLAWPLAATAGISRGLSVCGGVILPSLFPFLVLGGLTVHGGVAGALGRRLSFLTRPLFGLPGCAAPAILIAFIGGYPAGASAVAGLYRAGALSRDEARHMLRFCVCGGPGFLVSAVGVRLLGDARLGWLLFGANTAAALVIGVLFAPRRRRDRIQSPPPTPSLPPAAALVRAVTAACESALYMAGFILLFSCVLSLCDATGLTQLLGKAAVVLPCVLEVSSGCAAAVSHPAAMLLIGFAAGFGGLSVHCQVAAVLRDTDLLSPSFFSARCLHGVLGILFTRLLLAVIPLPHPVFGNTAAPPAQPFFSSFPLSAALFLLCGIWMLTVPPPHLTSTP